MQVKEIKNSIEWNNFILPQKVIFAQSFEWGEILIAEGKKLERVVIDEKLFGQFVYSNLIFDWKYVFCPKGPVGNLDKTSLDNLIEYFKKQGVVFLRIEPNDKIDHPNLVKTIDVNPHATLILDLQKSEEEILAGMHPKTRYNIRLAQKKNLVVKEGKNLEIFLELMKKTGDRDNFRLHETRHYEEILKSDFSKQLIVYSEGTPVATAVFVGFGETFTYLFGASDHEYRQLMAPNLLQWSAIVQAKNSGYKYYDFFGVAPKINNGGEYEFDTEHQYGGVSRFKIGFGGKYVEAPGTFDLVVDKPKYYFYKFLRKLRRIFP